MGSPADWLAGCAAAATGNAYAQHQQQRTPACVACSVKVLWPLCCLVETEPRTCSEFAAATLQRARVCCLVGRCCKLSHNLASTLPQGTCIRQLEHLKTRVFAKLTKHACRRYKLCHCNTQLARGPAHLQEASNTLTDVCQHSKGRPQAQSVNPQLRLLRCHNLPV